MPYVAVIKLFTALLRFAISDFNMGTAPVFLLFSYFLPFLHVKFDQLANGWE